MAKPPRIRIELSLDGSVIDATVLADSAADRDRALRRLQLIVPMLSVFEDRTAPEGESHASDGGRNSS